MKSQRKFRHGAMSKLPYRSHRAPRLKVARPGAGALLRGVKIKGSKIGKVAVRVTRGWRANSK